jgi:hypothetical protein
MKIMKKQFLLFAAMILTMAFSVILFSQTTTTTTTTATTVTAPVKDTVVSIVDKPATTDTVLAASTEVGTPFTTNTPVSQNFAWYMLYIAVIVGFILHFLTEKRDAKTKGKKANNWLHIKMGIATLIFSIVVVYCYDFIPLQYQSMIGQLNPFTCFLLGYFSDSVFKKLTSFTGYQVVDPKV